MHHLFLNAHGLINDTDKGVDLPLDFKLVCFGPQGSILIQQAINDIYQIFEKDLPTNHKELQQRLNSLWLIPAYSDSMSQKKLYKPSVYDGDKRAPDLIMHDLCSRQDTFLEHSNFKMHMKFETQKMSLNWRQTSHHSKPSDLKSQGNLSALIQSIHNKHRKYRFESYPIVIYWLCCQSNPKLPTITIKRIITDSTLKSDHKRLLDVIRQGNLEETKKLLFKYSYTEDFINRIFGAGKLTALHVAYARQQDCIISLLIQHRANQFARDAIGRIPKQYSPIAPIEPTIEEITPDLSSSFCSIL